MQEIVMTKTDEMVMKLLHYFITEEGYNPIILHGVNNEIWLENLNSDYKVIRIVSNYIHNDEQLHYDLAKANYVLRKIKVKTFSFTMPTLNLFVNMGENVSKMEEEASEFNHFSCVKIKTIDDIQKSPALLEIFPNIQKEVDYKEKGLELFIKLTTDINKKNEEEARKAEDVFSAKKPIVTYTFLIINLICFLLAHVSHSFLNGTVLVNKTYMNYEYYRLLTAAFLHYDILHLACNMYALYVLGPQLENFLGHIKYAFVYIMSAITGSLLSMAFLGDTTYGLGASGAIFGLLGSLLYFGYHYRVYLGNTLRSQIIPIIILNLGIGFMLTGIDNFAHIGGLIGGILATIAVGIKYKSTTFEKVNGAIVLLIYIIFLGYIAFVGL